VVLNIPAEQSSSFYMNVFELSLLAGWTLVNILMCCCSLLWD